MNLGYVFAVGGRKIKDFSVQEFLFVNGYRNVVVYYSGDNAGINLGGWKEKKLSAKKLNEIYAEKIDNGIFE